MPRARKRTSMKPGMRAIAIAFQHHGARHLAVTLEDRPND
jgi:hypothetical protein